MIDVKKALEIVIKHAEGFGVEEINFLDSHERILKEQILADRDFPPYDRVCMDGIAVSYPVFSSGKRNFSIEGIQAAGNPQMTLQNSKNCIEVMTGAILPKNSDLVIPYEQIKISNGIASINTENAKYFQNIHTKGKDRKVGETLIKENTVLTAAEIGVLATVGKSKVKVAKQPKIIIISTGDELVDVSKTPLEYQIRKSNVFSLIFLLKRLNLKAEISHLPDNKDHLKKNINVYLNKYDVLLFSGAVSKGKFDFIPKILEELGVKELFYRVKQRPGKPLWFGKKLINSSNINQETASSKSKIIFAFPGNPVSTYLNCLKYFYPWYKKSMGISFENPSAKLKENFNFNPPLTYFLQVKLEYKNGEFIAIPQMGKGSGDLANLVDADAFMELPASRSEFKKESAFPILKYRNL